MVLNPAEIWTQVYGSTLQNGQPQACKPFVEFLQYQIQGTGEFNMALYNKKSELTQPRALTVFLWHRNHVLSHLQPFGSNHRGGTSGSKNTAPGDSVNAGTDSNSSTLGGLTFDQLQSLISAIQGGNTTARTSDMTGTGTPHNTIEKRLAGDLETFLKLCMVTSIVDLPPEWAALAQGPCKEERQILQAAVIGQPPQDRLP